MHVKKSQKHAQGGRVKAKKAKEVTKKSDTRYYPSYPLTHPFLERYKRTLRTQSEGGKTEGVAVAMCMDLSKFLNFATAKEDGEEDGPGELEPKHLSDISIIDDYLQKLEDDGIEASGQLTKVQWLSTVLEYALYQLGWYKVPALKARSDVTLYFLRKKAQMLQGMKSAKARKTLRDRSLLLRHPNTMEEVSFSMTLWLCYMQSRPLQWVKTSQHCSTKMLYAFWSGCCITTPSRGSRQWRT